MEPQESSDAKKMLLNILNNKKPEPKNHVYVEDDNDELESESQEYFEPPVVPRSAHGQHKIAFRDSKDNTVTSNVQESRSAGSTVSFQTFNLEPPMEYEEIIQKLEADIRRHIRIQNQLKLHIETLQAKVDEKEKAEVVKDKHVGDLEGQVKKLKQSLIDLDRKKEEQIKQQKEHSDNEIKKLNEKIQKLNKTIFEQSKVENRNTLASAIPHSSIERTKMIDSVRSNTVNFLHNFCRAIVQADQMKSQASALRKHMRDMPLLPQQHRRIKAVKRSKFPRINL